MAEKFHGLYVITSAVPDRGRTHLDVARAAVAGGARIIQLRDKTASSRQLLNDAQAIREITRAAGALFIVNDRLDIALAAEADGVHLGEEDLPIGLARKVAGEKLIIGASAGSVAEAQAAAAAGTDYLGVGCIFPTPSKPDTGPPLGCAIIREIKAAVNLPLIAIGGINATNAKEALQAGADGLAVISAVSNADDMVAATRNLLKLAEG